LIDFEKNLKAVTFDDPIAPVGHTSTSCTFLVQGYEFNYSN
jgi:hypothetical protein